MECAAHIVLKPNPSHNLFENVPMFETNPLSNLIKDLTERTLGLRGYL